MAQTLGSHSQWDIFLVINLILISRKGCVGNEAFGRLTCHVLATQDKDWGVFVKRDIVVFALCVWEEVFVSKRAIPNQFQ